MRRTHFVQFACLLTLLALTVHPALGQQERPRQSLPEGLIVEEDVEYGRAGDRVLKLDIARPKAPSKRTRPVVAWIHGGGWRNGSKAGALRSRLLPFAASGNYVCVSIGYRLSGEAIWPAQIHDCKAAIRWLKANAAKYNIDPERIGVWGSSAGGHLVSLLGTSADVAPLDGSNGSPDESSRVACVVDYCGPSDFLDFAKRSPAQRQENSPVQQLFGGPVTEKEEAARLASPATHVSADDPPFLIVHGTNDETVPLHQAELFNAALKKAGVDATFVRIEGGGHGFGGVEVTQRVVAFFEKHLRGQDVDVSDEPIVQPASAGPASRP